MSHVHGHQNHGHHHAYGLNKGPEAKGKSGEKAAPTQAPEAQSPASIDSALKALDAAIAGLVAGFNKDSYNGQAAPEGVTPAASTVASPLQNVAGASTFAPSAELQSAPAARDPLLDAKGGGGLPGGVTSDFLRTSGGGALPGGVTSDFLSTRGGGALPGGVTSDRF
jgi:hypothetical protein